MNSFENISVMKGSPFEVIGGSFKFNVTRAEAQAIAFASQGLPITQKIQMAVEHHPLIPQANTQAAKLIEIYNEALATPIRPAIRQNLMLNIADTIIASRGDLKLADQNSIRKELAHLAQTGVVEMMTTED